MKKKIYSGFFYILSLSFMNNKERIIRNEFEKYPQFIEALIFANEVRCMMDYILQ